MAPDCQIGRRQLMILGGGLLLGGAGCSTPSTGPSATTRATSSPPATGSPGPATTPSAPGSASPSATAGPSAPSASLPRVGQWRAGSGEIEPKVKLTAVRVVEAIGSWAAGGSGTAAAEARVAALGQAGELARQAGPLLGGADRALVQVIDAQYGGIRADAASVLVPCRQWRLTGRRLSRSGTTADVRLRRTGSRWRVTALHPAEPGPADPMPSRLAAQVLASSKITLPPAAAADVRSGQVHDSVLSALLRLAENFSIDVSVISSGHPTYVFGTNRLSDHPRGRAFDTWRIDGHPVVDPATPKKLITTYMQAAAAAGSYNVGGPYQLSGQGTSYFTDATHHDHVHAGFRS
jgi:hypothetical protein